MADERRLIWRGSGCTVERRGPFVAVRVGEGTAIIQQAELARLTHALAQELSAMRPTPVKPGPSENKMPAAGKARP